jgi:hypothetical protein
MFHLASLHSIISWVHPSHWRRTLAWYKDGVLHSQNTCLPGTSTILSIQVRFSASRPGGKLHGEEEKAKDGNVHKLRTLLSNDWHPSPIGDIPHLCWQHHPSTITGTIPIFPHLPARLSARRSVGRTRYFFVNSGIGTNA